MKGVHWAKLHALKHEARERVAQAWAGMDEIDADRDLSPEGKDRQKKRYAADAIAAFQASKALVDAKDAVNRQLAVWATKTGLAIKPPSNIGEAVLQSEIRAHLAAMKGNKIAFLKSTQLIHEWHRLSSVLPVFSAL